MLQSAPATSTLLKVVKVSACNEEKFNILLKDDSDVVWEITKSMNDFIDLSASLKKCQHGCPELDCTSTLNDVMLLQYLEQIIIYFHDDLLNVSLLVSFFDNDVKTSNMTNLQLRYLKNQIKVLQSQSEQYQSIITNLETKSFELLSTVDVLQRTCSESFAASSGDLLGSMDDGKLSLASKSPRTKKKSLKVIDIESDDSSSDEGKEETSPGGDFTLLFSLGTKSVHNGNAIDEIIDLLQPHDNQLQYRYSALGYMRKQIRVAVNGTGYDVGLQELCCNLPDDPIKISVMLCKSQITNWQRVVCDALLGTEQQMVDPAMVAFADTYYDMLEHGFQTITNHTITNTTQSSDNMSFKVNCLVDQLEVEITSNARTDLCMLAFLQEVSEFVGQNYLFKRSILLIRAWWVYETAYYVGSNVKHYLSDFSICIMITAIFNQFHAEITSPLQALSLFLSEYSGYDGSTHAITLYGILPFTGPNTNTVIPFPPANYLINDQLFDRYWPLFNVSQSGDEMGRAFVPGRNDPQLVRQGFNIVHPFTTLNMVTEKISSKRVAKIHKVLQLGATKLMDLLLQSSNEKSFTGVQKILGSFFPATKEKYKANRRVDALPGSENEYDFVRSRMDTNLAKIWQNIAYCNLIMEAVLSESALLTLTSEILAEKGALPVGEVGKTLTELTCIPSLSQKLKEKFGGLKKFLERFTDLFVFSNDHPFNPHVLLRYSVAQDQLDMIDRGLFPSNLLMKTKRPTPRVLPPNPLTIKKPSENTSFGGSANNSPYLPTVGAGGGSSASTPNSFSNPFGSQGQQSLFSSQSQSQQPQQGQQQQQQSKQQFGSASMYGATAVGSSGGNSFFGQTQQSQNANPPQSKVIGGPSRSGSYTGSVWSNLSDNFGGDSPYFDDDQGWGGFKQPVGQKQPQQQQSQYGSNDFNYMDSMNSGSRQQNTQKMTGNINTNQFYGAGGGGGNSGVFNPKSDPFISQKHLQRQRQQELLQQQQQQQHQRQQQQLYSQQGMGSNMMNNNMYGQQMHQQLNKPPLQQQQQQQYSSQQQGRSYYEQQMRTTYGSSNSSVNSDN